MFGFSTPEFLPCPDCGESVYGDDQLEHVCDVERLLEYVLRTLDHELAAFDDELRAWLESPDGRFACWLAERERTR